jgi:membrane-associated protein
LVQLNVWQLGAYCTVAAIAGNLVGYAIGRRGGAALFRREDSRFFKRSHLVQAHQFYERHGGKTIVIARFMPIIRTFVPVVAGAAEMNFGAFAVYSIAGGTAWIWSMLLIGYFIATRMPVVGQHIEGLIVGIVFVSVLPAAIAWWRSRKRMSAP